MQQTLSTGQCLHLDKARLKEIGARRNQRCLIFQCIAIFFKGRSLISVFIVVPSWYVLICMVKFNIFEIKFNEVRSVSDSLT